MNTPPVLNAYAAPPFEAPPCCVWPYRRPSLPTVRPAMGWDPPSPPFHWKECSTSAPPVGGTRKATPAPWAPPLAVVP